MTDTTIANAILQQLGGNRFIAMTGAKNFIALDNGVKFTIGKNISRANMVKITLNGKDLYDVEYIKFTPYKFNVKTMTSRDEKAETIAVFNDYYDDMLQANFTSVTGLYTHL